MGKLWLQVNCITIFFFAQCADLHSVGGTFKKQNTLRRLGALKVSPEGFVYWKGRWTIALMQFCDNALVATDAQPQEYQQVVEEVCNVLEEIFVQCGCADEGT